MVNLTHFLFFFKPLETYFKCMLCYVTEILLLLGTHILKEVMKNMKYHQDIGIKTLCIRRRMWWTKGLGQRKDKAANNDYFIFDSKYCYKKWVYAEKYLCDEFFSL